MVLLAILFEREISISSQDWLNAMAFHTHLSLTLVHFLRYLVTAEGLRTGLLVRELVKPNCHPRGK